jgi:DNA-binding XRE family transcriptional regulator
MSAFAKLTGISRETLYRWKKGNAVTDTLRLNLAHTYARHLDTAAKAGDLPLKGVSPKERTKVLRAIIAKVMRK